MGINVEPTLTCDRCQRPIERGRKVIEVAAFTYQRIENPAYSAAYVEQDGADDYDLYFHPACILKAVEEAVESVLDFDCDTITMTLLDEDGPGECDEDHGNLCCGIANCVPCHGRNEDLVGVPGAVFGVDRAEWDSYGQSPYSRACGQ